MRHRIKLKKEDKQMSIFKRAEWHSGLTYRQRCDQCRTLVEYQDNLLDFRPWFADGFVYCPKCKKPLRHSEKYAIDAENVSGVNEGTVDEESLAVFCCKCGNKFKEGDLFCCKCGNKR